MTGSKLVAAKGAAAGATKSGPVGSTAAKCPKSVRFQTIMTSEPVRSPLKLVWHWNDDFSPRLNELAKVVVNIRCGCVPFNGTLRVDFGRLTSRPDNPATADVNESFTLVARVEVPVALKSRSAQIEAVWDGRSTVAVPLELSNRTTQNVNTPGPVNIPLNSIANGAPVTHGLYVVDQITLLEAGVEVARDRPEDVTLSVPQIANLIFNAHWVTDLTAFGLAPFASHLEEGLRRFGGRDFGTDSPNQRDRINVRFVTDSTLSNANSMVLSIGGTDIHDYGHTPDGPAPLSDNLYAMHDSIGSDISIFPSSFMFFNMPAASVNDQIVFSIVFYPMGVDAAATDAVPGTANARAVVNGTVAGACTAADDLNNVRLTMDAHGMATVTTTNVAVVPGARAREIQAALRAFVLMVGSNISHELAHALGVVSRVLPNNQITIGGVTLTSPLNGSATAHNLTAGPSHIMDPGHARGFVRRLEWAGAVRQRFEAENRKYLIDCVPYDPADN